MGVPKFFRYISERYPCLSEVIKEYQIPEFDNLYLDMNGIIHVCSHPNDADPHFRITEEKIFTDVFHYIEILFRMIQPKKLFFMAVDGVAPRAKMNQQRGRRFRSAKEAETVEKQALSRGEILPSEKRFDSNCITPGTVFMARLQEQLKYFVSHKISTDKIWQLPQIILSGHETPGEGEHKIMDYIRWARSQPGWDPNTRHCLYGLDADLIMLGMCTHEPHFSLLREEVKFRKQQQKRTTTPEETTFFLLHLSLLRDYLDLEFQDLKTSLPFNYDIERIIDDWVLMGFLVGNDFIPNLPGLNIASGALHLLYKIYIEVLPKLGGYINDSGVLNLERFEAYLQRLAQFDIDQFRETYADHKYFEGKTGRKLLHNDSLSFDMDCQTTNDDLKNLIESTKSALENGVDSGDESDVDTNSDDDLMAEFVLHKRDYYMNKLDYGQVTMEVLTSQAEGYVRAIQWNLHYYYHGCPSWSWFYPHHYAPYISDIKGFSGLRIEFDLGRPFLPFQQLLAVLPSASKEFLPEPLQKLMVAEDSPLIEYYPKDFMTDMAGKKQEWEGVVLIPFIDQDVLLKAMEPCYEQMTDEEKRRNSHGPMHIYQFTLENLGVYEAPDYFPPIAHNHARVREVWAAEICVERKDLVRGLYPGVSKSCVLGFPSLAHVPFTASLEKAKVKVFENQSWGENMMLKVKRRERELEALALELLSKVVLVGWPHLVQAKVSCVSTVKLDYRLEGEELVTAPKSNSSVSAWNLAKAGILSKHKSRMGIELGEVDVLVWAHPLQGTKLKFDQATAAATLANVWCKEAMAYPVQTTLSDVELYRVVQPLPRELSEVFPLGSACFILTGPAYGSQATVVEGSRLGRVKVETVIMSEPDLSPLKDVMASSKRHYFTGGTAGQRLGVGAHLFSRITGSIFIQSAHTDADKANIGLNLKFNRKNEELVGFTRKEGTQWLYSQATLDLVRSYTEAFPELFHYLAHNVSDDIFFKDDVFPSNGGEKVREIVSWLKGQAHFGAERRSVGTQMAEEPVVRELERILSTFRPSPVRKQVMQIVPYLLYQPKTSLGQIEPDSEAEHLLLDRVVNVRESHSIPLGLRGTIVGIEKKDVCLYDVVFDEPFVGGLRLATTDQRCYRLTSQAFINLSHGARQLSSTSDSFNFKMDAFKAQNSAFATCRNKNVNTTPQQGRQQVSDFYPSFHNQQPPPRREGSSGKQTEAVKMTNNELQKLWDATQGCGVKQTEAVKPTADSEFQALWDVLQRQKVEGGKSGSSVSQPPREASAHLMAVSQQTDALKKFLRLDNGPHIANVRPEIPTKVKAKSCGHIQCSSSLMNLCQKMGIPFPNYLYTTNVAKNEVTCIVRFPGVAREVVGPPEKEKSTAAEKAACLSIQMLDQGLASSYFSGHSYFHVPPPGFVHQPRGKSQLNQNLPTPPQQWYKHSNKPGSEGGGHQKWSQREQPQLHRAQNGGSKKGLSQFLPLQVQKGSSRTPRPKAEPAPTDADAEVRSSEERPVASAAGGGGGPASGKESVSASVSSNAGAVVAAKAATPPRRARPKPRLAAKFQSPIDN